MSDENELQDESSGKIKTNKPIFKEIKKQILFLFFAFIQTDNSIISSLLVFLSYAIVLITFPISIFLCIKVSTYLLFKIENGPVVFIS